MKHYSKKILKNKKYIIIVFILLISIILLFCKKRYYFSGMLIKNQYTQDSNVSISIRNYCYFINYKITCGTVSFEGNNANSEEYRFFGKTNSINDMYSAHIYKYNEEKNMMEMGTVYFDKKFENIIILSDVMGSLKFYSADESFIKSVDSLYIYSISD